MTVKEHPTHREPTVPTPIGNHGMGWNKDKKSAIKAMLTPQSPEVKAFFDHIKTIPLADEIDLREYASPIEDQGQIGSCTANAAMGCVELMQNKVEGEFINGSKLFTYRTTRKNIEGVTGDVGATITDTFKSLVKYGVCPEELWPYIVSKFDDEPPQECFDEALDYQVLEQVAINSLYEIKQVLNAGYPVEIGFFVFDSFQYIGSDGIMPIPDMENENFLGGHAVCVVGYKTIDDVEYLIVRNSWGESWGDSGYFYLPVEYLTTKYDYYGTSYDCCSDFRVILKQEYMNGSDDGGDDTSQNF